jgi:hypothetical protein
VNFIELAVIDVCRDDVSAKAAEIDPPARLTKQDAVRRVDADCVQLRKQSSQEA